MDEYKYMKYKNKYINEKNQMNIQKGCGGNINDFVVLGFNVTQFEKNNQNIVSYINGSTYDADDDKKISVVSEIPTDKLVDTFKYVSLLGADNHINSIGQYIIKLNSDCIKIPQEAVELAKTKTFKEGYGGHVLASLFIKNLISMKKSESMKRTNLITFANPIDQTTLNIIISHINGKGAWNLTPCNNDNFDLYLSILTNNIEYLKIRLAELSDIKLKFSMLILSAAFGSDEEAHLLIKDIKNKNYGITIVNSIGTDTSEYLEIVGKINPILQELKKIVKIDNCTIGGHELLITYILNVLEGSIHASLPLDKLKIV